MKARREGFTLIELLLTLAVVVVGLTSVIGMVMAAASQSRSHRDHLLVDQFAASVLATLQSEAQKFEGTLFAEETFALLTAEGEVFLQADGVRRAWPGRFADGRVPRLEYQLDMEEAEEIPGGVTVLLWVQPLDGEALAREYNWILKPGGAAW